MSAQEWKPGDKAYIEARVVSGDDSITWISMSHKPGVQIVPTADLLPTSVPGGDAIERAREALTTSAVLHDFGGQSDWDETPQHVTCECGEVFEAETVGRAQVAWHEHVIDEQVNVVRSLLASPVREPGRSEAEVVAASIRTHNRTPVTAENLRWCATHEALCRSWIFDVLTGLADLLDPAARVAGTTEAGDDRGCGACVTCDPPGRFAMRMYVCATCGNKRCPASMDCREWECSGSNDPDQVRRRKNPPADQVADTEGIKP